MDSDHEDDGSSVSSEVESIDDSDVDDRSENAMMNDLESNQADVGSNSNAAQTEAGNNANESGYFQRIQNMFSRSNSTPTPSVRSASASQQGPMTRSRKRNLLQPDGAGNSGQSTEAASQTNNNGPAANNGTSGSRYAPPPRKYTRFNTIYNAANPGQSNVAGETVGARRTLLEQQNQAYEQSLKADQEKDRIKAEKEKAAQEKIKAMEAKKEEIRQRRLKALENLPEEPNANEAGIITFMLRLPSGGSVRRNFRPTDTISTLRDFVISQNETPLPFDLIRYPNETIPVDDDEETSITLQDYGFKRKEVLLVRPQQGVKKNSDGEPGPDGDK